MALRVDVSALLKRFEMLGPLAGLAAHAGSGVLNGSARQLPALVAAHLLELLGKVLGILDFLPRGQHRLLDVAGEVALAFFGNSGERQW